MHSFRSRILLLWTLLTGVCGVLLFVLWMADRAGPAAQIVSAQRETAEACAGLEAARQRLVAPTAIRDPSLLSVVTDLSLRDAIGIEGGIWDPQQGFLAYAFPTHEAPARKTDMPLAERPAIEALVRQVSTTKSTAAALQRGNREVGVLAACALSEGQVAWTFTRVASAEALAMQRVGAIAVAALALVLGAGLWLLVGLRRWSTHLTSLEQSLTDRRSLEEDVPLTGERDLDRLVLAFNAAARHAYRLSQESQALVERLAHSERMGAIGRLAAGMAHEIRNPLGSIRLRAENALATSGELALERHEAALRSNLKAVERLERLVGSLLALTRPLSMVRSATYVEPWLRDIAMSRIDEARHKDVDIVVACDAGLQANFDEEPMRRAVDNLVQNALQHSPPNTTVRLAASRAAETWTVVVSDGGPGVSSAIRPHLFEPFATGRAEGTGLGLAIAREIVEAHHGRLTLVESEGAAGATFMMEFPWHAS